MKILVCASEYYPHGSGIANVAYNVVKQLKNRGIECDVCSPTGPDIKIGSIGKYGRLSLIYFWYKVYKKFNNKKLNYDAVWLHNPLFIKKNPFKKCLITIHSMPQGKVSEKIYPWNLHLYYIITSKIDEYCLNKIDKKSSFTVVDSNVSQELSSIGINKNSITYVPNGVDIELFKPNNDKTELKKKFNLPEDKIIILSLGRLTEHKQPLELIEIFSKISCKLPNLILVIVGDGNLVKESQKLVNDKNLDNVIKFLGHVDHRNNAPDIYACSDYYIMTSKYEGQPLTLLEAMASGLKCIVSDIPNLKMIVVEAHCGIAINVNDKDKSAKDIIEYINSNNSDHSINARKYAAQNFDWKMIANSYLEKFQKL